MKTYFEANVAIIVVVSFLAISLITGVALSFSSINYQLATMGFVSKTTMKQIEYSCQEEALRKISNNPSYVGNSELNLESGVCSFNITVNGTNPNLRDVLLNVEFNDYAQKNLIQVDASTSPITIIKTD